MTDDRLQDDRRSDDPEPGDRRPEVVSAARARILVDGERVRVEAALAGLDAGLREAGDVASQQAGDGHDDGSLVASEGVQMALIDGLRRRLRAVDRASERITAGTYGRSVVTGDPLPIERLQAAPLAERTVEEQLAFEDGSDPDGPA